MSKVCEKHREHPVKIYDQCVGCEIESLRAEIDRLKRGGWISVKERLPEGKGFVVVGNSNQWWSRPAWFDGEDFKTYEYGDRWLEVTHWQPMPEPPEKGE